MTLSFFLFFALLKYCHILGPQCTLLTWTLRIDMRQVRDENDQAFNPDSACPSYSALCAISAKWTDNTKSPANV